MAQDPVKLRVLRDSDHAERKEDYMTHTANVGIMSWRMRGLAMVGGLLVELLGQLVGSSVGIGAWLVCLGLVL